MTEENLDNKPTDRRLKEEMVGEDKTDSNETLKPEIHSTNLGEPIKIDIPMADGTSPTMHLTRVFEGNHYVPIDVYKGMINHQKNVYETTVKNLTNEKETYLNQIEEMRLEIEGMRMELDMALHTSHKEVADIWKSCYLHNMNKETEELDFNGFTDDVSEALDSLVNTKVNEALEAKLKLGNYDAVKELSDEVRDLREQITFMENKHFDDVHNLEQRFKKYKEIAERDRRDYSELKDRFRQLSDLVWDHFLAKDSKGYTGKDRNKEETTEYWNRYHEIVHPVTPEESEDGKRTLESRN